MLGTTQSILQCHLDIPDGFKDKPIKCTLNLSISTNYTRYIGLFYVTYKYPKFGFGSTDHNS